MPLKSPLLRSLGNEARLRILVALARNGNSGGLTVYKIARVSGLERRVIKIHLPKLAETDLIKSGSCGPISLYTINQENRYIRKLIELFNEARLLTQKPLYFDQDRHQASRLKFR